jgi:hypothetical protein
LCTFIQGTLELTNVDLLCKSRGRGVAPRPRQVLTSDELDELRLVYDRDTFGDLRNGAMMATFAATGLRFDAVRTLAIDG